MRRLVRSTGLDVQTFPSAQDFLDSPVSDGPCCLVLDVKMPRVTGPELQEILKEYSRPIPIIFVTGHGDIPMSVQAMKKGAIDFLIKPFDETELLKAIDEALKRNSKECRRRQENELTTQLIATLTPREFEVMTHVIAGLLNKQIGSILGIAEKTVKVHRARVMEKLNVGSVAELVRLTEKMNIIPVNTDK